jgi:hypothetical protein
MCVERTIGSPAGAIKFRFVGQRSIDGTSVGQCDVDGASVGDGGFHCYLDPVIQCLECVSGVRRPAQSCGLLPDPKFYWRQTSACQSGFFAIGVRRFGFTLDVACGLAPRM